MGIVDMGRRTCMDLAALRRYEHEHGAGNLFLFDETIGPYGYLTNSLYYTIYTLLCER